MCRAVRSALCIVPERRYNGDAMPLDAAGVVGAPRRKPIAHARTRPLAPLSCIDRRGVARSRRSAALRDPSPRRTRAAPDHLRSRKLRHSVGVIGAAEVTRRLAALLDAPAVLCGYSRLVIDCNRGLGDPTSIPEE